MIRTINFAAERKNSQVAMSDLPYEDYFQFVDRRIQLNPSSRILYRIKVQSLLAAGCYKEAFSFLEHSSALMPDMKNDLTNTYRKCGAICFDISEAITRPNSDFKVFRPDGDFVGPVEIRMTINGCGRGLFATEDIQQGDVILISKALAVSHVPSTNRNPLLQAMKEALNSCGETARQIFLSHCIEDRSQFIPKMSDFVTPSAGGKQGGWATLCEFFDEMTETEKEHEILSILDLIAFGNLSPLEMKEKSIFDDFTARMYYGIWLLPSFVNHSCAPNAARINIGDLMRIHATKLIKSGEEITIPYFEVLVPISFRNQACSFFGFKCLCKRCKLEVNSLNKSNDLYMEYERIAMAAEMEKGYSHLQKLLNRLDRSVMYLHSTEILSEEDEKFEKWYRASFTPLYFASLLNRDINETRPGFCLASEINFTEVRDALLETCPGSPHCLFFFHQFRVKLREFLALHGNVIPTSRKDFYEEYSTHAWNFMVNVSSSIYGNPHLQKIIDNNLTGLF